jgi:hypothetical protein
MQQDMNQETVIKRIPDARYAYYRRCQEFRRNGEQCKAPAEKGAQICHAHAGQRAMAERREVERRAVLAAAAAKMRCSMADLFTSFNGIQVTIATAAQALVAGQIDCKTAGRLLWDMQRMAKLLELYHRGTQRTNALTTKDTKEHKGPGLCGESEQTQIAATKRVGSLKIVRSVDERENTRIIKPAVVVFPADQWSNGPPRWAKAA